MKRRAYLAGTGVVFSGIVAGVVNGTDGWVRDDSTATCHLMHELADNADSYGDTTDTYSYEELSDEAQHVFEKTIATGSYTTTDRSLNSEEFRYWDEMASYEITYRDEAYVLMTYTGEGCESK